jgi:hypothetical protein
MNSQIECECVRRLYLTLGKNDFRLESPKPPAPDVRVIWANGTSNAFEVTEVHPDEVPGKGSVIRADEERRKKRNPRELAAMWIPTNGIRAIKHRVQEKAKKSSDYVIGVNEPLYLLLVGALAEPGAVAATFVPWQFLTVDMLNQELNALLENSRFQCAYLHLQIPHALWEWSRPNGWRIVRAPQSFDDGRSTLEMLRENANLGVLPGTHIIGS